ncbi:folate family ECF transporter S component [Streptococcus cameli]
MKKFFSTPKMTTQRLVTVAMLIGLAFIIDKFKLTIIPNQLVVSFGFIVNAIMGSITGPLYAFLIGAVEDVVTMLLSSNAANFIPLWTVMDAFISGLYGLFFYGKEISYNKKKDWVYVSITVSIITILGSLILTPLLIQIYFKTPFVAQYIAGRWIKIFEIPVRIFVLMAILPQLQRIPELRKLMGLKK